MNLVCICNALKVTYWTRKCNGMSLKQEMEEIYQCEYNHLQIVLKCSC